MLVPLLPIWLAIMDSWLDFRYYTRLIISTENSSDSSASLFSFTRSPPFILWYHRIRGISMMHRLRRYDVMLRIMMLLVLLAMMRCLPQTPAKRHHFHRKHHWLSQHHLPGANIIQKSHFCQKTKVAFLVK